MYVYVIAFYVCLYFVLYKYIYLYLMFLTFTYVSLMVFIRFVLMLSVVD